MIRSFSAQFVDERREAARLLRAMRTADPDEAVERTEWAYAAMPDNPRVQRRLIRHLIDGGHHGEAEPLVSRALLQRPTDPSFMLLRAECLAHRGALDEADRELRLALIIRPRHRATLELAASIAMRLGRPTEALPLLDRLIRIVPDEVSYRHRRIEALLAAGRVHQAAAAAERTPSVPPPLQAEVLRQQGRLIDAAEIVTRSLLDCPLSGRDELRTQQITLLEELGDLDGLRLAIDRTGPDTPRAVLAGARALLSQGGFAEAAGRAHRIRHVPAVAHQALHVLSVAAAMGGRSTLAMSALRKVHRHPAGPDRALLAECWRRGLMGRLLTSQHHSHLAGADPAPSIIQPMLEHAAETLDRASRRGELPVAERLSLTEQRNRCRGLLSALQGPRVEPRRHRRAA